MKADDPRLEIRAMVMGRLADDFEILVGTDRARAFAVDTDLLVAPDGLGPVPVDMKRLIGPNSLALIGVDGVALVGTDVRRVVMPDLLAEVSLRVHEDFFVACRVLEAKLVVATAPR